MKHYFVQNPNSGKNQKIDVIKECVIPAAEKAGTEAEAADAGSTDAADNAAEDDTEENTEDTADE